MPHIRRVPPDLGAADVAGVCSALDASRFLGLLHPDTGDSLAVGAKEPMI